MPNVHPLVALLVEERKRQDLTQQEVADRAGVARSAITQWESGERDPNLRTFCAVAGALGLDVLPEPLPWHYAVQDQHGYLTFFEQDLEGALNYAAPINDEHPQLTVLRWRQGLREEMAVTDVDS